MKDREAWHAVVHGVAKNQTRLSDWTTKGSETPDSFPSISLPRISQASLESSAPLRSLPFPQVTPYSLLRLGPPDFNVTSVTPSNFTLPPSAFLARTLPCPLLLLLLEACCWSSLCLLLWERYCSYWPILHTFSRFLLPCVSSSMHKLPTLPQLSEGFLPP